MVCGVVACAALVAVGYPAIDLGLVVLAAMFAFLFRAYLHSTPVTFLAFPRRALYALSAGAAWLLYLFFPLPKSLVNVSPYWSVVMPVAVVSAFIVGRIAAQRADLKKILVFDCLDTAISLNDLLVQTRNKKYKVVGCLEIQDDGLVGPKLIASGMAQQPLDLGEVKPDLIINNDNESKDDSNQIVQLCVNHDLNLVHLSQFHEQQFGYVSLFTVDNGWFNYIVHPKHSCELPLWKRAFDVFVAGILALPVATVIAIFAPFIKLDGGPVFYTQRRIGERGKEFTIYKLRSMTTQSNARQVWSSSDDSRVTRVGKFLRKTHLDEVPQLWNIFTGDMTLVGPRPEQPKIVEELERMVDHYSRRHLVRPGITGWAQVRNGYAGSYEGTLLKCAHDFYYIKNRSFVMDNAIIVDTVRTLFADKQWQQPTECTLRFLKKEINT